MQVTSCFKNKGPQRAAQGPCGAGFKIDIRGWPMWRSPRFLYPLGARFFRAVKYRGLRRPLPWPPMGAWAWTLGLWPPQHHGPTAQRAQQQRAKGQSRRQAPPHGPLEMRHPLPAMGHGSGNIQAHAHTYTGAGAQGSKGTEIAAHTTAGQHSSTGHRARAQGHTIAGAQRAGAHHKHRAKVCSAGKVRTQKDFVP